MNATQPKKPGPEVPDLRALLSTFGTAHPKTLAWDSPTNPGHTWLSHDARAAVVSALRDSTSNLLVSVSAGKGDAAETPWIAILRRDVTTTPQSGIYVVYLFCPDRRRIVLCIMLGVTRPSAEATLRRARSTRDSDLLRDLVSRLRKLIPATIGFDQTSLDIGGRTLRSNQYNVGFIYGRTYDASALPTNAQLVQDLHDVMQSYSSLNAGDIKGIDAIPEPSAPRAIRRDRTRKESIPSGNVTDLEAALQKRERATAAHERVVQSIARLAEVGGMPPAQETQHIDVLVSGNVLFEVKSLQRDDPQQIRDAVAQVLYYRFLYRNTIADPVLVLAVSRKPGESLTHLTAFAKDCGIRVIWLVGECFESDGRLEDKLRWLGRSA